MRPRFLEMRGGEIIDGLTGLTVATVAVERLDTATAVRVRIAIISALHAEFGPRDDGERNE